MKRPDFGDHSYITDDKYKVELTCRYIAPGLTLHDLTMIGERAEKEAEPGDEFAGNPSKWPCVRRTRAIVEAVLDAVYED